MYDVCVSVYIAVGCLSISNTCSYQLIFVVVYNYSMELNAIVPLFIYSAHFILDRPVTSESHFIFNLTTLRYNK